MDKYRTIRGVRQGAGLLSGYVSSLRAGDDVKTLQENMGHFTAAFTLDRYAHVTETMKRESANRMQAFIEAL